MTMSRSPRKCMVAFAAGFALCALVLGAGAVLNTGAARAHHGWDWTTGKSMELTGVIKTSKLGNPHGVLTLDVKGQLWTVEVGQPWRNKDAGLADGDFAVGNEIRLLGEPAANTSRKVIKALRVYIKDREHNLYPERK